MRAYHYSVYALRGSSWDGFDLFHVSISLQFAAFLLMQTTRARSHVSYQSQQDVKPHRFSLHKNTCLGHITQWRWDGVKVGGEVF